MIQPQLANRLTSMDASFLYFEKKEAPLHIGSIHLFEGELSFAAFVENMVAKLPLLQRYTQKIVPAPLNLGHPTWELDQAFDIKNHVFRLELAAPGTDEQFHELSEQVMLPMLSRDKPLWEIYLVYGLEGGRTGMMTKVHHAMIDGMSGIDLLKIIFDISPDPKPLPKLEPPVAPPEISTTRRIVESLLSSSEEGVKSWLDFQKSILNMAQTFIRESPQENLRRASTLAPLLTSPVSNLSFNKPLSGSQKLVWADYFFSDARAIRARLGGTVNDVILTVLTGAIARYIGNQGETVAGRKLRVMAPVSMRQEDQRGSLGNLVSVLPVEIPLDVEDPAQRLTVITRTTGALKGSRVAESVSVFTSLMGVVPASVQAVLGSLAYTPFPSFNIVCTNVPGPQIPLYALGHRMLYYYPYVPIAYAIGLGCAIVSYDQKLFFGITLDGKHAPEAYRLKDYLDQSFAELRAAAGVSATQAKTVETTTTTPKAKSRKRAATPTS